MTVNLFNDHPYFKTPKLDRESPVRLTYVETVAIVSQIYLALEHPKNKGPGADLAHNAAGKMAKYIVREFCDELPKDLLRKWERKGFLKDDRYIYRPKNRLR